MQSHPNVMGQVTEGEQIVRNGKAPRPPRELRRSPARTFSAIGSRAVSSI